MAKKIKSISKKYLELETGKKIGFKKAKEDIKRQEVSPIKMIKAARKNYVDCKEEGGDCKLTASHLRDALDFSKMITKKRKEKK